MRTLRAARLCLLAALALPVPGGAAELKVLTAGAFKPVLVALAPDIGSVAALRQTLLAVGAVATIDPAAGGSSGI